MAPSSYIEYGVEWDGTAEGVLKVEFVLTDGTEGTLRVWPNGVLAASPLRIELQTEPDPLTPTALARFPWSTLLAAADAFLRFDAEGKPIPRPVIDRHPGRRGHPRDTYEWVAWRLMQLRTEGDTAPAKTIAEELEVSDSTVRGWIRHCRRLELLPPARPGQPG